MPVERREQLERASAARAHRSRGMGLLLMSLAIVLGPGGFLAFVVLWYSAGFHPGDWFAAVVFIAYTVLLWLFTRGRRMRAVGAERLLAEDDRGPIAYLRPFGTDRAEIARRLSSWVRISPREGFEKTYEQRLTRTLHEIGPLVAVGDPTERLPLPGAARLYAGDEEWHEKVEKLAGQAGVLILHVGDGEGLAWEVRRVVALNEPERVILSLPLDGTRKEPSRQERYDGFRRRLGDVFPRALPKTIGHCQFMYFDGDWTPRLLGERGTALPTGESERARVLRQLAREFKIAWAPRWVRVSVYVTVCLAALWPVGRFLIPSD